MHKRKLILGLFVGLFSLCVVQSTTASIRYINLSPVIGQLPQIDYPALDKSHQSTGSYTIDIVSANYRSSSNDGSSAYSVDGETTTFQQTLELKIGVDNAGITNRWFQHSSGAMDQLIYDFHDLFGMPQNGRTESNKNQLSWLITSNNQDMYSLNRSQSGFGDTTVFYEFSALESLADVRISFTMPTGSTTRRTSTDTWGLTASSSYNGPQIFADQSYLPTLRTWLSAGATILYSDYEYGGLEPNPLVIAGRIGAAYAATDSLSLEAQLDTNSPYFDTDIRELGWVPLIASLALTYQLHSSHFQFGFNEDLRPSTSPDFSLFFAFRYDF